MFRLPDVHTAAATSAGPKPSWQTMAELERSTDAWAARLESERFQHARTQGGLVAVESMVDQLLRTNRVEYLDRDDCPAADKVRLVRALHRLNQFLRNYGRFLAVLRPHLAQVARIQGRAPRVLELASGSGEFTLAVAEEARREGLSVDITGSDVVPEYVAAGNAAAEQRALPVSFRRVNAFDMSDIEPDHYDVVFIAQSIHHFSPGQLAMMIAQARTIARSMFVAVDGLRSLRVLSFLTVSGLLASTAIRDMRFAHDAITSARKFYSASELESFAEIAAPGAPVRVRTIRPGHTALEVRCD